MKFGFFKTRKAQSATEYLMTYGWAILAIAIVGALLYTQVFSTKKCAEGAAGFPMTGSLAMGEYSVDENAGILNVRVTNNVGKAIVLQSIDLIAADGTVDTNLWNGAVTYTDGQEQTATTTTGINDAINSNPGDCYSYKIRFTYQTCTDAACAATTGITLTAAGTFSGALV